MTLFDKMVSDMRLAPGVAEVNIQHEVMQKIALDMAHAITWANSITGSSLRHRKKGL